MPKPPKRHHYTPVFYLKNFTDASGVLHIIWRDQGHRYESKPEGVGFQKDFYTLEDVPPGEDPYASEVIRTRAIPDNDDKFNTLMNFVALAATRVPTTKAMISKPLEQIGRMTAEMSVSSKERFEAVCKDAGIDPAAQGVTYESMREFVKNNMHIYIPTAAYISHVMTMVNVMLPLLAARKWCVLYTDELGRHLVVTDHPVSLTWTDPIPHGFFGPGFGLGKTDVTVPLSSNVGLLGRFEDLPKTQELSAQGVAGVNSKTMAYCQRFIGAAADDFTCQDAALNIITDKDVLEQIKKEKSGAILV